MVNLAVSNVSPRQKYFWLQPAVGHTHAHHCKQLRASDFCTRHKSRLRQSRVGRL